MSNSNFSRRVLLDKQDQPVVNSSEWIEMSKLRSAYMGTVGGLLWLANITYPELAYFTGQLARFMTNPGPAHFKAATRVLLYLRTANNRPLVFKPERTRTLETYVDSSWATGFSCSGTEYYVYVPWMPVPLGIQNATVSDTIYRHS